MRTAIFFTTILFPYMVFAQDPQWTELTDVSAWRAQSDACTGLSPDREEWWTPCSGRVSDATMPFSQLPGTLLAGRLNATPGIPDFMISSESRFWGTSSPIGSDGWPKVYMRSLVLTDYDTVDLALRRADNASPDETDDDYSAPLQDLRAVPAGDCLGKIYWQALGVHDDGNLSFYAGNGGFGRNALIEACAVGDQTAASRAGELFFSTTPINNPGNTVRRMRITSDGQVILLSRGSEQQPVIRFEPDTYGGIYSDGGFGTAFTMFDLNSPASNRQSRFAGAITFPDNSGDTSLVLVWRASSQQFVTRKVSVGAANSCGTGRRCLYIEN